MKVVIFGATGMVGQGVLRECLADPGITEVLAIGRSALGTAHAKLRELVHADLYDYSRVEAQLAGYDACFFCLGVSAAGMSEAEYRRVTFDLTLAAATALVRVSPALTFIYVSGQGTSAASASMWARVKGETENALLSLPFKAAYMFRPGLIQPLHGIVSKTPLYRAFYAVFAPLMPLVRKAAPAFVITTEEVGRAMIRAVRHGAPKKHLENRDLRELALKA